MKSLFGIFPWHPRSSHNAELPRTNQGQGIGATKISSVDSKMMEESKLNVTSHSQKRQRKMTTLLRLNSVGEIGPVKNFCDPPTQRNNSHHQLRLSNSFDSSYPATKESSTLRSSRSISQHIPHHKSFKKSLSEPSQVTTHQSFPPPSSAIRKQLTSTVCENLCPYSISPRNLGSIDIFGTKTSLSHSSDIDINCSAMSSSSVSRDCNMNVVSTGTAFNFSKPKSKSMNDVKKDTSESNCSFQSMEEIIVPSEFGIVVSSVSCPGDKDGKQTITVNTSQSLICLNGSSKTSDELDGSQILIPAKKKRKRPRKKRKGSKKLECASFKPTSCSSPIKDSTPSESLSRIDDSDNVIFSCASPTDFCKNVSSTDNHQSQACEETTALSNSSAINSSAPSPKCKLASDSEVSFEDNCSDDDIVFEDSVSFKEDNSTSKLTSKAQKRKCKNRKKLSFEVSDESDNELSNSPSTSSALQFTFSLTFSEDEDNDSNVEWDTCGSPLGNDQFSFEFQFNTGLSLEAIIGQTPSSECPTSKELKDLNAKWNKIYASKEVDKTTKSPAKVQFACDEDLETVYMVGDEDRAGEWHRFAQDRARFKRRIEEVEKAIAPILCVSHRAKVLQSFEQID